MLFVSAAACAPATRQRVLTFFFDGVPGAGGEMAATGPEAPSRYRPKVTPLATPVPVVMVSVHAPVFQRKCNTCHDPMRGLEPREQGMKLCDECHGEERKAKQWNHGPINLGTCVPCHRAHESQYPHLLQQPVPDLCTDCHRHDFGMDAAYHAVPDLGNCTRCHDAHRTDIYREGARNESVI